MSSEVEQRKAEIRERVESLARVRPQYPSVPHQWFEMDVPWLLEQLEAQERAKALLLRHMERIERTIDINAAHAIAHLALKRSDA